jgi:hypothetical protein
LKNVCQEKSDHEKAVKYVQLMAHPEVQSLVLKISDCIDIEVPLPDV